MRLSLSIPERLVLLNLLPTESYVHIMKLVRKTKEALGFSEQELKKSGIRMNDNTTISWERDIVKEFDISDTIKDTIVERLKDLQKNGKIKEEHISLWDKFILGDNEDGSPADTNNGKS